MIAFNFGHRAGALTRQANPYLQDLFGEAHRRVFSRMLVTRIAALLGLLHALWWLWYRRTLGPPVAIAISALLGLLATSIGGGYSGHYYLFFVPSYLLLGASGIAFAVSLPHRATRGSVLAVMIVISLADIPALHAFTRQLAQPPERWPGHALAPFIGNNTRSEDLIWAPWKPLLYAESKRLSPTKWFFTFDHLFVDTPASTADDKYAALRQDLAQRPPKLIVLNTPPGRGRTRANADAFLQRAGLAPWIAANYRTLIGSDQDPFEILVAKGSLIGSADSPTQDTQARMQVGLDALYKEGDPIAAVLAFYDVLDQEPRHYGAHLQVAKALDAADQRLAARRAWERFFPMAQASGDTGSLEVARRRLSTPETADPQGWMAAGLSSLYVLADAPLAVSLFRRVLAAVPTHYGANLQLARALDRAGLGAEARAQWQVVMTLAEQANDEDTRVEAQRRLAAPD